MEREPVTSSVIKSVGYDSTELILEVEFSNGSVYQYHDVMEYEYSMMMSPGTSLGSYLKQHIAKTHRYQKIS